MTIEEELAEIKLALTKLSKDAQLPHQIVFTLVQFTKLVLLSLLIWGGYLGTTSLMRMAE